MPQLEDLDEVKSDTRKTFEGEKKELGKPHAEFEPMTELIKVVPGVKTGKVTVSDGSVDVPCVVELGVWSVNAERVKSHALHKISMVSDENCDIGHGDESDACEIGVEENVSV